MFCASFAHRPTRPHTHPPTRTHAQAFTCTLPDAALASDQSDTELVFRSLRAAPVLLVVKVSPRAQTVSVCTDDMDLAGAVIQVRVWVCERGSLLVRHETSFSGFTLKFTPLMFCLC